MKVRKKKGYRWWLLALCMGCMMAAGCAGTREDGLVSLTGEQTEEWSEQTNLSEESLSGQEDMSEDGMIVPADTPEEKLFVYVCGAVNCPGVYQLPLDSRVYEAVDAAGGLREDAAAESINQAQKLEDGLKLYVPTKEEAAQGVQEQTLNFEEDGTAQSASSKININSATAEELKTLPGIGDAKAQSIVSYRSRNGMFQSIEDLMNVEGIKNGVFDKIKDRITV